MDLTESIAPRSDQANAEDFLTGPRTVTIVEVRKGASAEQPVDILLDEFGPGRPFKPSKTVRRILVAAWGAEASAYAGRRMTLYRDPDVKFGGLATGGIRVSHLSHIDKPMTLVLAVSKGKRAPYVVKPLADDAPPPTTGRADSITPLGLKRISAGLTELGITDREAMLATVSQVIDREISSSSELTATEADAVLDWIKHEQSADAEPTGMLLISPDVQVTDEQGNEL